MTLGSILIQPQKIRRAKDADPDYAVVNDVLCLATRLLDRAQGAVLLSAFIEAIETTSDRMVQRSTGGFETATQRLRTWFNSRLDSIGSFSGATAGMQLGQQILLKFADLAASLTLDQLRGHVNLLLNILQTDLGLTDTFLADQVWGLLDGMIQSLEQIPAEADTPARENRLSAAGVLRRFKHLLQATLFFPQFNGEAIAQDLLALLRKSGIDQIARQTECVARGLTNLAEAGKTLSEEISFSGETFQGGQFLSPGVALAANAKTHDKSQYCWYATWLLESKSKDLCFLEESDLEDVASLAAQLKGTTEPLIQFLRQKFSEGTKQLLDEYEYATEVSKPLQMAILDELNLLIQEPLLLQQNGFPELELTQLKQDEDIQEMLETYEADQELLLLNRMILENLFFNAIDPLPRTWFEKILSKLWKGLKQGLGDLINFPGEHVQLSSDGKHLRLGEKLLFRSQDGTDIKWQQAPIFDASTVVEGKKFYSFDEKLFGLKLSAEGMENLALYSSCVNDAINSVWHLASMQPGHRTVSILNSIYELGHGTTKLIVKKPFSGFFSNRWLQWLVKSLAPFTLTTLASLEGRHTEASGKNKFAFWVTIWLADLISWLSPILTTTTLRDATLSFCTLYNFRGGPQLHSSELPPQPAENHNEIKVWVDLSVLLWTYVLVNAIDRQDYGNPFQGKNQPWGTWLAIWLAGGAGMGLLAGFTGVFVGEFFAWAEDWSLLGKTMLKAVPQVWLKFWFLFYSFREGDTDDGKYNPRAGEFKGYPDKSNSPYRLPYAAEQTIFCGQANQGVWSHNVVNPSSSTTAQIYAFDFSLDQAVEVLASRPGTVVDFYEDTPDDTEGHWNNIIIRHDVDDNGNPIDPDLIHDRGANGMPTVTFAVYGHGRNHGVTDAFARWTPPVPRDSIRGTRVKRGQPIMLAGDTGTSFHNHLHMHVLPPNLPIAAIQCGWAVGANGTILTTANGGITWTAQTSNITTGLNSIYMRDGQRGWAVGANGTILTTANGGTDWATQTSGTTQPLNAIQFLADNQRGWAVGANGTILTTPDGGTTWTAQTSGTTQSLNAVQFLADGQRGWAVGANGTIFITPDGGTTWTAQTSGTTQALNAVQFLADGQRGWAVGANGTILTTPDGGTTWTAQTSGTTQSLNAVQFLPHSQRGWVVGANGTILSTADSGTTWTARHSGATQPLNAVQFLAGGENGWAVGANGTILSTLNGGTTWITQSSGSTNGLNSLQLFPTNLPIAGSQRVWAVGADGTILTTLDGGTIWTTQSSGTANGLNGIHVRADGQHGWAVGASGTILATPNGGATWSTQTSGTTQALNAVQFLSDGQHGWAAGANGTILTTPDGGATWSTQTSGTAQVLNALLFLSDGQHGWAVGANGTILTTANGGTTWTAQTSGTTQALNAVQFLPYSQRGWAVGANGTILTTANGGTTWTAQTSGTTQALNAVQFLPYSQRGWAVGANGTILTTTNGGATWTAQTSSTTQALNALLFLLDGQRGWVVGANGIILTTTNGGTTWIFRSGGTANGLNGLQISNEQSQENYTIPFVFQDVDEDDGVCQHLNWYTSSNARRTS